MVASRMTRRASLRVIATGVLGLAGTALLAACGGAATSGVSTASSASVSLHSSAAAATTAPATVAGRTAASTAANSTSSVATGSASTAVAVKSAAAASGTGAHLVFLDPDGAALGDVKIKAVADFNAQDGAAAGIQVERVFGNGAATYEKLQTMTAGGTPPDVFWSWLYWKNAAAAKGLLEPFDAYVARETANFYASTWSPGARDSSVYAGKLFGFAAQLGVPGVYVNEDLFHAAGLALPSKDYGHADWTLAAYLDAAHKLTRRGADGTPTQFGTNQVGWWWWAGFNWIIESFGGAVFNPQWSVSWLDHPEDINALTWVADLVLKERVAPTSAENKNNVFTFDGGKTGLTITWAHSAADHVKTIGNHFNWNVYPLPRGTTQKVSGCAFNWYCLTGTSQHKDAGWQFVRYMAAPPVVQRFLEQGLSFPFMTTGAQAMWQNFPQLNRQMALEAVPLVTPAPAVPRDPEVEAAIKKQLTPAMEGQQGVQAAALVTKSVVDPLLTA